MSIHTENIQRNRRKCHLRLFKIGTSRSSSLHQHICDYLQYRNTNYSEFYKL